MSLQNVFGLAQPVGPHSYEFPSARYGSDQSAQLVSIGGVLEASSADATDLATYYRETRQLNDDSESEIENILEALVAGSGITFEKLADVQYLVDHYIEGLNHDVRNIARQFLLNYAAGNLTYPEGKLHRDKLSSLPGAKVALIAIQDTELRVTWGAEVIDERVVKEGDVIRGFVRSALDLDPITLTQSLRHPTLDHRKRFVRAGDLHIETLAKQASRLPFGISGPTFSSIEDVQLQVIDPETYQPLFTDAPADAL